MGDSTRNETQYGLADLKKRLTARGVAILNQQRPWPERLATYFVLGSSERKTNIVIPDSFLADLPNTKEHQLAVDSYAEAVGGRMKYGSPELFYCQSGIAVQISIQWPVETYLGNPWIPVYVVKQPHGEIAKCNLKLGRLFRTPFGDVEWIVQCIRRSIDAGKLIFHEPDMDSEEFQKPDCASTKAVILLTSEQVQSFLAKKVFVLGFEIAERQDSQVWTQDHWDVAYLGTTDSILRQAARLLKAQGLVDLDSSFEYAKPTDALLKRESVQESEASLIQKLSRLALPTKEVLLGDMQTALARDAALAVVLIDLDNFKQLNDSQGHSAGDALLDRVVDTIETILGNRGKLYRWGSGDEFVALLLYVATEEARATAERIRSSIQGIKTENEVQVTVSIGVCATDLENKNSTQEILDFADRAMYKSKQAGRNRVTTWASMVGS